VHSLAIVGRRSRGQTLAEAALTIPLVIILILGIMQVSLLAYGAMMARFAAFAGLRAAAVAPGMAVEEVAGDTVAEVLSGIPGLTLLKVSIIETPIPMLDSVYTGRRFTLTVRVRVPRVIPSRGIIPLDTASVSCAMPMEPPR